MRSLIEPSSCVDVYIPLGELGGLTRGPRERKYSSDPTDEEGVSDWIKQVYDIDMPLAVKRRSPKPPSSTTQERLWKSINAQFPTPSISPKHRRSSIYSTPRVPHRHPDDPYPARRKVTQK